MNISKIQQILEANKEPKFRLKQIEKAGHQGLFLSFSEMTFLPEKLRQILEKEGDFLSFSLEKIQSSDDSHKALLKLKDGNCIETVLISPSPGVWSACVSSQVGCPLKCEFCATGKLGLTRDLSVEEITDQIIFWRNHINQSNKQKAESKKLNNIVFMGMGEPFLNWANVKEALENLLDENKFNFSSRGISVSTAGVPDGIEEFGKVFPQMNLAISLHFADQEKRARHMPIAKRYNLDDLTEAIENYLAATKRKIFLEYVMLDGINDSKYDADSLVRFVKKFKDGYLLHVNLIQYNETGAFKSSSRERATEFKNYLVRHSVSVTIRKSLGGEISAACGQLAGERNL